MLNRYVGFAGYKRFMEQKTRKLRDLHIQGFIDEGR